MCVQLRQKIGTRYGSQSCGQMAEESGLETSPALISSCKRGLRFDFILSFRLKISLIKRNPSIKIEVSQK